MQRTGHVLVVDDQNDIVDLIVDFLRDEGYDVRGVTDGTAALTAIAEQPPALILLDMFMPQMTGTELWEYLQSNQLADIPVVLMTASPSAAEHLLAQGATDYLAKPFDLLARGFGFEQSVVNIFCDIGAGRNLLSPRQADARSSGLQCAGD